MSNLRPAPNNIARIRPAEADALYQEILQLAYLARDGEINSLSYSAFRPDGRTVEGVLGRARQDVPRAHLGVIRLSRALERMFQKMFG